MNIKEAMEKIKTGDDMTIDLSYLATMVLEKEHLALRRGYMKPFALSPSSFEAEAYKAGVIDMADRIILGLAEMVPIGAVERERFYIKWTRCSDKMPDKDGEYLVAGKNCHGSVVTDVDQYFSGLGFFDDFQNDAIAWAEMPKYEV